jgi:hypothetical protein
MQGLARRERETPRNSTVRIDGAQQKFKADAFGISFNIVMT